MRLYELSEAYQRLQDLAADGEEGWDDALGDLEGAFEEKAINVAKVIRSLEAERQVFHDERDRLALKASHRSNAVTRLKDYLQAEMESVGLDQIKGDVVNLRLQKGPPSVEIADEETLPPEWIKVNIDLRLSQVPTTLMEHIKTRAPDKALIMTAHKDGDIKLPEGVTITQRKHLRIT